jgi:hypothetical protein
MPILCIFICRGLNDQPHPRPLQKDYETARSCHTKLFYRMNKYPSSKDRDEYMELLIEGGYRSEPSPARFFRISSSWMNRFLQAREFLVILCLRFFLKTLARATNRSLIASV